MRERLLFIDLARHANEPLADGPGGSGNDLNRLPRGIRDLDGLDFRVGEDMVHLAGTMTPELPREVKGIKVARSWPEASFPARGAAGVAPGTEVGVYVVHYADGSTGDSHRLRP